MITYVKQLPYNEKNYIEIACNSEDTKPTEDIATGSVALEADTGDVYVYDEVSEAWVEMCSIKE